MTGLLDITIILMLLKFAGATCPNIVINEIVYDNAGSDTDEWVELYDGGAGNTVLDGMVLAGYNGNGLAKLVTHSLTSQTTDSNGYNQIYNIDTYRFYVASLGSNKLQNDNEIVLLVCGSSAPSSLDQPTLSSLSISDLVLYEHAETDDDEILTELFPNLAYSVYEIAVSGSDTSISRCNCSTPINNKCFQSIRPPTPGSPNDCPGSLELAESNSTTNQNLDSTSSTIPGTTQTTTEEVVVCPANLVISEIVYNNPGADDNEWVEIYDGGTGGTSLKNVHIVHYSASLWNMINFISFADSDTTDANGYHVGTFTGASIRNGEDAIILSCGNKEIPDTLDAFAFQTSWTPLDALVYEYAGTIDLKEIFGRGYDGLEHFVEQTASGSQDSISRCTCNTALTTSCFEGQRPATPGTANNCPTSTTSTTEAPVVCSRDVVLSEIEYDNDGTDAYEWVEVHDGGIGGTDLSNIHIAHYSGSSWSLASQYSYTSGTATNSEGYDVRALTGLQNDFEAVLLICGSTVPSTLTAEDFQSIDVLDALVYEWNSENLTAVFGQFGPNLEYFLNDGGKGEFSISRCHCSTPFNASCFMSQRPSTNGYTNDCPFSTTTVATTVVSVNCSSNVIINEIEYDNIGTDTYEWVEVYDSGVGGTSLDNIHIAHYRLSDWKLVALFDFEAGTKTNEEGYKNASMPGLQNSGSAVILFCGSDIPITMTAEQITKGNVMDAIVYEWSSEDLSLAFGSLAPSLEIYVIDNGNADTTISRCECLAPFNTSCFLSDRLSSIGEANNCPSTSTSTTITVTPLLCPLVIISEVEYSNPGVDDNEWIELYDGGVGNTSLADIQILQYSLPLWNRALTIAIGSEARTNAEGYYLYKMPKIQLLENDEEVILIACGSESPTTLDFDSFSALNILDALVIEYSGGNLSAVLGPLAPGLEAYVFQEPIGSISTSVSRCWCQSPSNVSCYESNRPPTPNSTNDCMDLTSTTSSSPSTSTTFSASSTSTNAETTSGTTTSSTGPSSSSSVATSSSSIATSSSPEVTSSSSTATSTSSTATSSSSTATSSSSTATSRSSTAKSSLSSTNSATTLRILSTAEALLTTSASSSSASSSSIPSILQSTSAFEGTTSSTEISATESLSSTEIASSTIPNISLDTTTVQSTYDFGATSSTTKIDSTSLGLTEDAISMTSDTTNSFLSSTTAISPLRSTIGPATSTASDVTDFGSFSSENTASETSFVTETTFDLSETVEGTNSITSKSSVSPTLSSETHDSNTHSSGIQSLLTTLGEQSTPASSLNVTSSNPYATTQAATSPGQDFTVTTESNSQVASVSSTINYLTGESESETRAATSATGPSDLSSATEGGAKSTIIAENTSITIINHSMQVTSVPPEYSSDTVDGYTFPSQSSVPTVTNTQEPTFTSSNAETLTSSSYPPTIRIEQCVARSTNLFKVSSVGTPLFTSQQINHAVGSFLLTSSAQCGIYCLETAECEAFSYNEADSVCILMVSPPSQVMSGASINFMSI